MGESYYWLIVLGLVTAMALVCGAAAETIALPLPAAILIGLGLNAALLLWGRRESSGDLLSPPRRHHHHLR
jgi:uncharacterized membrane protein YdfJ with MMPL/SSD domain